VASNNATLGQFTPSQVEQPYGGQAHFERRGVTSGGNYGMPVLVFSDKEPEAVIFSTILQRPTGGANSGYTGTTGIKVNLFWRSGDKRITGNVRWICQIALCGQTDLPDPTVDLWSATYEVGSTATVSATAGAVTQVVFSITIANIKGAQTTSPAVGDIIRTRIRRSIPDALDTMLGPADLVMVELQDY
jgi:hypothetical protein